MYRGEAVYIYVSLRGQVYTKSVQYIHVVITTRQASTIIVHLPLIRRAPIS